MVVVSSYQQIQGAEIKATKCNSPQADSDIACPPDATPSESSGPDACKSWRTGAKVTVCRAGRTSQEDEVDEDDPVGGYEEVTDEVSEDSDACC